MAGAARPGSVNRSHIDRPADDFYPSPRGAIVPFLRAEPLRNRVWEPACGDGAMARVLQEFGYDVVATNLTDRGYGERGVDFLATTELPPGVKTIITNPPNYCLDQFIAHAIALRPDMVAIFTKTVLLEGDARYRLIFRHGTLGRLYQMVDRVVFYAGDSPKSEQPGWSKGAFAWFVFWPRAWGETDGPFRWLYQDDGMQSELDL